MHLSIATVSLGGTLEEKIEAISEAGFDGIEVFDGDLTGADISPQEIRTLCEERALTIDLYQPLRDIEGVGADTFEENLRRADVKLEVASDLGATTMLLCSNASTAISNNHNLVVSQISALGDLARSHGVRIAYEALAWGRFINTYEQSWQVVRDVAHESVGLCLDSFHIFAQGSSLEGISTIPGEKIFSCQLADAPIMNLDALSWSRHYRVFPGQGRFDVVSLMQQLLATGYDGSISLEVFNDIFRQVDPKRVVRDGQRSLRHLLDQLGCAEYESAAGPSLVPIEEPDYLDLIEIGSENGELLRSLCDGPWHPTMETTIQVGRTRIRVRPDSASAAPAIAAVGYAVPDPMAPIERADQLLISTSDSHGSSVPRKKIASPDGSDIYFARSTEQVEYQPTKSLMELIGATGIDHLGLAVPWDRHDEFVLFYRSLLGFDDSESVDIADPLGLVRSHVMTSSKGRIKLALNVLPPSMERDGDTCTASHSQHIAIQVHDIFTASETLHRRGVAMLNIPSNYYADLHARYPIDLGSRRLMQEHNVLYDRDSRGEFYQFYTRGIGDMFIEFVERVDEYQGYGAVNAPVRRAAQRAVDDFPADLGTI